MVYNVGKANKSVLPSAKKIAVVGSKPLGKTLSKNSIRNPNENVKKNDSAKSDTVKLSARKGETTEKALSHFGRTYSCSTGDGSVCSCSQCLFDGTGDGSLSCNPSELDSGMRACSLHDIEKAFNASVRVQGKSLSSLTNASNAIRTVADLFAAVKRMDADFQPNSASKVINADKTPKVMYQGTTEPSPCPNRVRF